MTLAVQSLLVSLPSLSFALYVSLPLHQGAYRSSKTHKEYQSMSSENRNSYQTYHNDCPKKSLAAIADLTECCSHLWIIYKASNGLISLHQFASNASPLTQFEGLKIRVVYPTNVGFTPPPNNVEILLKCVSEAAEIKHSNI